MTAERSPVRRYPQARVELCAWLGFLTALIGVLVLDLVPALLAGLLVYALVDLLVPVEKMLVPESRRPRLMAVVLVMLLALAVMSLVALGCVWFFRHGTENLPALIQRMAEIVEHSRESLPAWTLDYLPDDEESLRRAIVEWLRGHADFFQGAGTGLGRGLAHVLIGMVIGALLALARSTGPRKPLSIALARRALRLNVSFRRVIFAQVWISSINTVLTSVYLLFLLPAAGIDLPFTKTLIVITFVAGLVPILGNLISNTVIFIVSLSHSLIVAVVSLGYLIVIHKLEYFLNARIIGGHVRAHAWELLLAMLIMEAAFGIPGLIIAPVYYAYLKAELSARGLL